MLSGLAQSLSIDGMQNAFYDKIGRLANKLIPTKITRAAESIFKNNNSPTNFD
jgi:hypothetical protein